MSHPATSPTKSASDFSINPSPKCTGRSVEHPAAFFTILDSFPLSQSVALELRALRKRSESSRTAIVSRLARDRLESDPNCKVIIRSDSAESAHQLKEELAEFKPLEVSNAFELP
jgi:hypothetical protein